MRIGFFGGTFDPPHRAHAMVVLWALQSGEVDRVLVVPMARHPFGKQPAAPFHHRVEMCRLMISEFDGALASVSTIEGERDDVSYTVDTVRELAKRMTGCSFRLIVGTDVMNDLPKWREADALLRLAPPLGVPRMLEGERSRPGALPLLSSTQVRDALFSGGDVAGLIPYKVVVYIRQHHLYDQQHE